MNAPLMHPRVALGNLVEILSGFAFKSERFADAGDLPVIRIRDVKRGYSETYYSGDYDGRYIVRDGDLLIGMDGEFNRELWSGGLALLNQRVCKLAVDCERLSLSYLYHFLPKALKDIEDRTPFATVKHLSSKDIKEIEIPLPPLVEQQRIAAILDKANELRRKSKRAVDLVGSVPRSVFLETFGDPVKNPKGLPKIALGDLIKVKSGESLVAKDMAPDGSYPVYGGNGINGCHDKFMFEGPKLVIGRVGVYCGAVHLTKPKSWVTDNALYVAEFKRPISEAYLKFALIEANLNQYAGRAAQPLISGSRIYPVEVLLPSKDDQTSFEKVTARASKLVGSVQARETSTEFLFASLQSRAFSGQL